MNREASEEEVQAVMARLRQDGYDGQINRGVERVVIGVFGSGFPPEYPETIENLSGVATATRVSKPYKLASREWQHQDTVIEIAGAGIGSKDFVVMAGPCAVES